MRMVASVVLAVDGGGGCCHAQPPCSPEVRMHSGPGGRGRRCIHVVASLQQRKGRCPVVLVEPNQRHVGLGQAELAKEARVRLVPRVEEGLDGVRQVCAPIVAVDDELVVPCPGIRRSPA